MNILLIIISSLPAMALFFWIIYNCFKKRPPVNIKGVTVEYKTYRAIQYIESCVYNSWPFGITKMLRLAKNNLGLWDYVTLLIIINDGYQPQYYHQIRKSYKFNKLVRDRDEESDKGCNQSEDGTYRCNIIGYYDPDYDSDLAMKIMLGEKVYKKYFYWYK